MVRGAVTAGILLALCGVIGWISPAKVCHPLAPGEIYDVAVAGNAAAFDLRLIDASERYLLIVANVARDPHARRVTLFSEGREKLEAGHLQRSPRLASEELPPAIPRDRVFIPVRMCGERFCPPQPERTFWLHVGPGSGENPATYRPIAARLAAEGPHVAVYVDCDDAVDSDAPPAIVYSYEQCVLPTVASHLGTPADVDSDGRLAILMTSWLGRLDGGDTSLGGMVWSDDFRHGLRQPFSNQADVLYLHSGVRPGAHLETLLAHELAHAITASGRLAKDPPWSAREEEETWLNEAISHVAENLHSDNWSNLDYRIAAFLAGQESTPLVVPSYQQHGLWRCPAARGCTYLFLRWCVDRYGPGLLSRLIHSPRCGAKNVEAATGAPFDELLRRWAIDLFVGRDHPAHSGSPVPGATTLPPLEVHRRVGRQPLSGPRCQSWDLARTQEPPELHLCGTSFCYLLLSGTEYGVWRVHVQAEPGAALQLTLLRLDDADDMEAAR